MHAKGASLGLLVELVQAQPHWRALDVATGAGHVALAIAPDVADMVASDLTTEMLDVVRRLAAERGLENLTTLQTDAETLDVADASFDLVTTRIAPHHFPNPDRFVAEVYRALRPGGTFGFVDNVVPTDPEVATFANDWERRRDPSHVRALSVREWEDLMTGTGFTIEVSQTIGKAMDFAVWADNMDVSTARRAELWDDLLAASDAVREFLRPTPGAFVLTESIIVARK